MNEADITVEGRKEKGVISAALQSPPTHSSEASPQLIAEVLALFGYTPKNLNAEIPTALANAGANHMVLCLNSREALAAMKYDLGAGRDLMNREGLVTILFAFAETPQLFHTRNSFASGGVYEDPATGAATAAFAGYLRDIQWPHRGCINVVQGEDMGMRSLLTADIPAESGRSIRVSGHARLMKS